MRQSYPLFYQKPYHCAMACLQMALFRHTGKIYDQEALWKRFGVKVDVKSQDWFEYALWLLTSLNNDEGISTIESEKELNEFFKEEKIPLVAAARVADGGFRVGFTDFLLSNLKEGNDVWIEYAVGEKWSPKTYVHDSLVTGFDETSGLVHVLDPNPDTKNRRTYSADELFERMSWAYGKTTGVVILKKTDSE